MDTRTRARLVTAVVLAVGAVALVVLGLWTVYGLTLEYGAGALGDLWFVVVPLPTLAAAGAVSTWPGLGTRVRVAVVLGTAALVVAGGLAAEELGARQREAQLVADSEAFTCNGPNVEVRVPEEVDRTWDELPREAPVYGPVEGGRTDCVAAVAGDGEQAFVDYTAAFRDLDGWEVEADRPQRFVMVRDDVRVTVRLVGAPDRLTTIRVGLR